MACRRSRLAYFRHELGLDQPVWKQFLDYVWRLAHGDFGVSLSSQQKVLTEFLTLFPATLELSFFAMLFAIGVGVPAGAFAAVKRGGVYDQALMTISLFGYSMPIFWWGLLLIMFVSVRLGLLPVSGRIDLINYAFDQPTGFMTIDALLSDQQGAFLDALRHLVLPAIVLGTVPLAVIARMTRSSMLEVLNEDYVRTARAKGLTPRRVIGVHALRNALLPVVTVIGLSISGLMAGRGADGDHLFLAGRRPLAHRFDRPARLPGAAGRGHADFGRRDRRQSDGRSRLRRHRSEDSPWPLTPPRSIPRSATRRPSSSPNPRRWRRSGPPSARTEARSSASPFSASSSSSRWRRMSSPPIRRSSSSATPCGRRRSGRRAAPGVLCSEPTVTGTTCCRASSSGRGCRCSSASR